MYRYIAVAWHRENPHAVERARRIVRKIDGAPWNMRPVLQMDGLTVYCASSSPASFDVYRGSGQPLVVLGKLFHGSMNEDERPTRVMLDEATTRKITDSRGGLLMERYWGSYVAFGSEEGTGNVFVVRDPLGHMPCYVTSQDGVSVVFSCMEDCIALGVRKFSTNWRYVSAFLLRPYIEVRQTGLNEVTVVAPGECLELRAGAEHRRAHLWRIVDIAAENPIEDVGEAVGLARATLRGCTAALVDDHPQVMHRLSGGLDSSVVLSCLLNSPSQPEVTCIHHFDHNAGADERHFARMAVEGASARSGRSCQLLEIRRTVEGIKIEQLTTLPRTACPSRYMGYLYDTSIGPRATANGSSIQFSGHGGDATFGRLWDYSPVIDYVWRHGLGRHLPRIALESSHAKGTFYGALSHAIRNGLLNRRRSHTITKQWNMIDSRVIESVHAEPDNHLMHAWRKAMSADDRRLSPEKIRHIDLMTISWAGIDPYDRLDHCHRLAPINSQPVIELFARLPLYVLMDGAEDRTVTRRAFAPYLPQTVLGRRTKGFLDDFTLELTRRNAQFLRETYLDGVLIKEGILDRQKVESVLAKLSTHSDPIVMRLLGPQLNMETWLRNWQRGEYVPARETAA